MIDVIVPVMGQLHLTSRFMRSAWVSCMSLHQDAILTVVDNSPDELTQAYLASQNSGCWRGALRTVRPMENLGFSASNNLGLDAGSGEVVIFTSNDVLVEGEFIRPVLRVLERESTALVGAQLLDYDTGWNAFDGQVIPYLAGWFIACKRDTIYRLGRWDERYFPCDYEDIDLSLTASKAGMPLEVVRVPLRHEFGQTASKLDRESITLKNRELFRQKWGFSDGA